MILTTVLVAAALVGIYILFLIRTVLIMVFIAALLATAIAPLVERLRKRIGQTQAILGI